MDKIQGKFSKKSMTDIESFVQLSDGKVLTGSTWGSLLLWYDGDVTVEIKRRDMSPCHRGSVLQFVIAEGELISIGADGWIRVWDLESIQQAEGMNLEKEDGLCLLDPINEVLVAPDAILQSISKSRVGLSTEENFWYIQDAGGGIWKVDLSFSLTMRKPEKIFQCHAGAVKCLVTSPSETLLISGGMDGRICAYNLNRKVLVSSVKYNCGVTFMHWLPLSLDTTGTQVLIGFEDGVLRVYYIMANTAEGNLLHVMKAFTVTIKLLQAIKPHRKCITKIITSIKHALAASSSEDDTIFIYRLEKINLMVKVLPIGYVRLGHGIISIDFHPESESPILMIAHTNGMLKFIALENLPTNSSEKVELETSQFQIGSISLTSILKKEDVTVVNAWYDLSGLIQCTIKLEDSIELITINRETEIEDLLIMDTISIDKPNISSQLTRVASVNGTLLVCGFSNGYLQLTDVKDVTGNNKWMHSISDSEIGEISDILVMEGKLVISGMDGTLFVFDAKDSVFRVIKSSGSSGTGAWNTLLGKSGFKARALDPGVFENIHDIEDPNHLCIEDMNAKLKEEHTNKEMEENMLKIQKDVSNLKRDFKKLLLKNETLPHEYKVPKESFRMTEYTFREIQGKIHFDLDIMKKSFQDETDKASMLLSNLKARYFDPIEFNKIYVKGIQSKQELSTFRLIKLDDKNLYDEEIEDVVLHVNQLESFTPKTPKLADGLPAKSTMSETLDATESNISSSTTNLSRTKIDIKISNDRIIKALSKQEEKREKKMHRKREWDELHSRKPRESDEDPTLIAEIKHARENIGDFKRKTMNEFKNKNEKKPSEISKTINDIVKEIYNRKKNFNERVLRLRSEKSKVINRLEDIYKETIIIQDNLDPTDRIAIPPIPILDSEEHEVDLFSIEVKDVEKMKMKLVQDEEEMEQGKRSIGSRRSSKASLIGRKFSKQSSVTGSSNLQVSSKDDKKLRDKRFTVLGPGETLEEDEGDQAEEEELFEKSEFEINLEGVNMILAKHMQRKKVSEMLNIMKIFDEEIFVAVCEKAELESVLKYSELSLIFLFEEFQIVNQDQELEAELKSDVEKQMASLEKINIKLSSVEKQLKNKQRNVEAYIEQKRSIDEIVERELSDNKHSDFLWGLYNKKPQTLLSEDCYADIALEMGFNQAYSGTDHPGDNVSEDDEIHTKPGDLDMETFKLIREFRNKKHDAEAGLSGERRLEDNIGRELTNLKTISDSKESSLNEAQNVLHSFMLNKQKKLNQLDQVIILNLYDLRYLEHERLANSRPSSDELLSFPEDTLSILQQRTEELKYEKNVMKKKYKETKNIYEGLIKTCKELRKDIQTMDQKCNIEMEKRFGSGVTLESLEAFAVNRTLEEMKESLQMRERYCWKLQDKKEEDIKVRKSYLTEKIVKNSEVLSEYTNLQRKTLSNIEKNTRWDKLILDNAKKHENDKEREVEIRDLKNRYQKQGAEIQELKSVLMNYLMKSELDVEPKKMTKMRPLTARLKQEPKRIQNLETQIDETHIILDDIPKRMTIPTIHLKL